MSTVHGSDEILIPDGTDEEIDQCQNLLSEAIVGVSLSSRKETDKAMDGTVRPMSKRSIVAFWIIGLCNNYGYVVMLSAAADIIKRNFSSGDDVSTTLTNSTSGRECSSTSTGAILLADIIPSFAIKLIVPFFPLFIQMAVMIILSAAGFILVAEAKAEWVALAGVVSTALSSGIGEASMLSYMAYYKNTNSISAWSSGTGGAGFFGSLSYMAIALIFPVDRAKPMYILLIVPLAMGLSFWFLLEHPEIPSRPRSGREVTSQVVNSNEMLEEPKPLKAAFVYPSAWEKVASIPTLFKYMLPLGLVYFLEYFINQGLSELITFNLDWLDVSDQYIWYQLDYQIGVFISRSSINILTINKIWIMSILQAINVVLFFTDAVYSYIPNIYIVFLVIFWEGFLGGAAYVNTYNRVSKEVPIETREFAMGITSFADAIGISIAGFIAIPVHNYICALPVY